MKLTSVVVFGLCTGLGFAAGQWFAVGRFGPELQAQGSRGPVNAPPPPPTTPTQPNQPTQPDAQPVYVEENSNSAAGNGFLAVTGSYGIGTSVLYLVDTKLRQLAVYEARGGSPDMRRIVFVGARKIDLDLQLEGYNDRSEYEYRRLRTLFDKGASKEPKEVDMPSEGKPNGK